LHFSAKIIVEQLHRIKGKAAYMKLETKGGYKGLRMRGKKSIIYLRGPRVVRIKLIMDSGCLVFQRIQRGFLFSGFCRLVQ
jgi:hypothetical protein